MLIKQVYTAAAVAAAAAAVVASRNRDKVGWRGKAIRRRRATMLGICEQLGPAYFRRAFHMTYETFCKLNNILSSYIIKLVGKRGAKPNLMGQMDELTHLSVSAVLFVTLLVVLSMTL